METDGDATGFDLDVGTIDSSFERTVDPYKIKGKVEIIKGVEILEPGYKQEDGPKYTTIEQLKEAGYHQFQSKKMLIKTLSENDFDGEAAYNDMEAWFTKLGKPMFTGMTLDEFVLEFDEQFINVGDPSKDVYTNRVFYDTITLKVNGHGIGLYQTYLCKPGTALKLTPFSLNQVTKFIP